MKKDQKQILRGAIDVHAHYVTKSYRDACTAAGENPPDGIPALPDWSPDMAYNLMDRAGIATALLSISSPGVHFGDDAAACTLTLQVNEEGANIVANAHGRFGLLASLPLPDIGGAVEEIAYAFDVLHADGIALLSNYHGKYLGHAHFEPVMAELDKRQVVATIHPTSPPCWEMVSFGRPRPILEFPLDATRAVVNLALSRTLERYPHLHLVIPHIGEALPVLADRVQGLAPAFIPEDARNPIDVISALRRLYYDMAGTPLPRALPALLSLVDADQLLYGSDFPFTPTAMVEAVAVQLAETNVLNEKQRQQMVHGNALRLFPKLNAGNKPK
jgi:predicted TIM-barrel fold metal-dependent hydrolase